MNFWTNTFIELIFEILSFPVRNSHFLIRALYWLLLAAVIITLCWGVFVLVPNDPFR